MTSQQLILRWEHKPAQARQDFLVALANAEAFDYLESWPDWPSTALVLAGPPGSGKTHLAHIWRARSSAQIIEGRRLSEERVPDLVASGAIIVENADELPPEREPALFHLINHARDEGAYLLLTGRRAPGFWPVNLPDLASRLRAMPCRTLGEPDDALLAAVLVKLFDDRQLTVPETLIPYLISRIDRSLDVARQLVERLDMRSLSGKRPITRALAAEVLDEGMS